MSRTSRHVALLIILVAGVAAFAAGRWKWLNRIRDHRTTEPVSTFVFVLGSAITWQALVNWFHIPAYAYLMLVGILSTVLAFIVIRDKRRKRTAPI